MKSVFHGMLIAVLFSVPALAQTQYGHHRGQTDVIVDLPPEAWTQNKQDTPSCLRCCLFENRQYSEGAVVKTEGVLLQCVRDEKSIGTNNLIWRIVK